MAVNEFYCAKLSPNKKSIFGLRMGSQIPYLLLLAASFLVISSSADTELSCTNVKNIFERKEMLSSVDIQEQPNSDADGLCQSAGCCGRQARARLTAKARAQLEGALRSELSKLSDTLAARGRKFDEFFRKLLQLSREEFHAMFKRTYGMIYEQHSYVFEQLFEQLENYYARGDVDFDRMMDGFFGILYQKMFTVLNSQYSFDDKYLKCVNSHMREIQPFEDVPSKLSVQLRRAIVATRTFHKALRAGADVVRNMIQVGVTGECVTSWSRLRYCGACGGQAVPACSRYCHNVLRGCLPQHADLNDHWDAYVDAVEKVADRLLGPFNIAMVVEPIDIKISEAIMSFQEHNQEISQKIFAGCGKPVLGGGSAGPFGPDGTRRTRRDTDGDNDFEIEASLESLLRGRQRRARAAGADPEPRPEPAKGAQIDFRAFEFDGKRGGGKKKKPAAKADDSHGPGAEWGGPALERLVRETRARLRSSRRYWSQLPALLCTATSVTTAPCFNGTSVASYTLAPAGEGSAALASNPEVRSAAGLATGTTGGSARAQQETLRTLTARLKDAYNGQEVHWKDADDLQVSSSSQEFATSEGSGSGSGDDSDDDDDNDGLPDDDEDRQEYPEGSGDGGSPISEPAVPAAPSVPSSAFVPSIVDTPATNNVNVRGRAGEGEEVNPEPPGPNQDLAAGAGAPAGGAPAAPPPPPVLTDSLPPAPSHAPPSLQRALFAYAFPVVCAWFGTILTDLF